MTEELKPCPFCGNPDVYFVHKDAFFGREIYCGECDMTFDLDAHDATKQDVAKAWNRRAQIMTDKLKPCPFCGGKAEICTKLDEGYRYFWVRCVHCCAYTLHVSTPETAAKRWNRR